MEQQATHTNTYRKLVKGTTINSTTLLSTDYLNHFNELVMLLEMVPDMPDMIEEVKEWKPKSYQEHFRDSAFTHKDLAVMAYEHSPPEYRAPFDRTIADIHARIDAGLPEMEAAAGAGDPEAARSVVLEFSKDLQVLMDRASGIINGIDHFVAEQDELVHEQDQEGNVMNQNAIDNLFN